MPGLLGQGDADAGATREMPLYIEMSEEHAYGRLRVAGLSGLP